eukprot:5852723-Pyramimonas_sp.AAC.1
MSTYRGRRRARAGAIVAEALTLDAGLLAGRPCAGRTLKATMPPVARAHSEEHGACSDGDMKPGVYIPTATP